MPLTETEIEILVKGVDLEAIECYDKYYELHPDGKQMFYEKPVALKMFQNILKRCRNSGNNGEAKDIVLERLANYFDNEFYEKVNWAIESFSKNFNQFVDKTPQYTSNLKCFN